MSTDSPTSIIDADICDIADRHALAAIETISARIVDAGGEPLETVAKEFYAEIVAAHMAALLLEVAQRDEAALN